VEATVESVAPPSERTHDRAGLALLDRGLEGREVDLLEGALADDVIVGRRFAVSLLVIGGEMLHIGDNTAAGRALRSLNTLDIGCAQLA
jgi:hypothetical protein